VRNEEVLHTVKEEINILNTIKRRKANWIGHIFHRNCLLKQVIEGKLEGRIEITGRGGRRRKQLNEKTTSTNRKYWKLKEEALDRTMWRARFGTGYVPVVIIAVYYVLWTYELLLSIYFPFMYYLRIILSVLFACLS
jgi:hypothetical protein